MKIHGHYASSTGNQSAEVFSSIVGHVTQSGHEPPTAEPDTTFGWSIDRLKAAVTSEQQFNASHMRYGISGAATLNQVASSSEQKKTLHWFMDSGPRKIDIKDNDADSTAIGVGAMAWSPNDSSDKSASLKRPADTMDHDPFEADEECRPVAKKARGMKNKAARPAVVVRNRKRGIHILPRNTQIFALPQQQTPEFNYENVVRWSVNERIKNHGIRGLSIPSILLKTPQEECTPAIMKRLAELLIKPTEADLLIQGAHCFLLSDEVDMDKFVETVSIEWQQNRVVAPTIGLDAEGCMNYKVSAIQIAFASDLVVFFRVGQFKSLPLSLSRLLEDDNTLKTGCSVENDCYSIQEAFGTKSVNMLDLDVIAAKRGMQEKGLVSQYFLGVEHFGAFKTPWSRPNGVRLAPRHYWDAHKLSKYDLEYGANDALASLLVYRAHKFDTFLPVQTLTPWHLAKLYGHHLPAWIQDQVAMPTPRLPVYCNLLRYFAPGPYPRAQEATKLGISGETQAQENTMFPCFSTRSVGRINVPGASLIGPKHAPDVLGIGFNHDPGASFKNRSSLGLNTTHLSVLGLKKQQLIPFFGFSITPGLPVIELKDRPDTPVFGFKDVSHIPVIRPPLVTQAQMLTDDPAYIQRRIIHQLKSCNIFCCWSPVYQMPQSLSTRHHMEPNKID
ncbi:hypothetical protein BC830DRAFT_768373 [Chytriomyces sp. MP71]|nr:hypothetical protein BC830DRAFT_768373 [Chytriomyces sp. MP71]